MIGLESIENQLVTDGAQTAFYLISAFVFFLISVLKGAFGGGFGILTVPVMAAFVSPVYAAAVAAPLFCIMDLFAVRAYQNNTWNMRVLRLVVPPSIVGIGLGSYMLGTVSGKLNAVSVSLIAIVFSLKWFVARAFPKLVASDAELPKAGGVFLGFLSGISSAVAHSGGPPITIYLLSLKLPKFEFASVCIAFFTIGNAIKLVPYLLLGLISYNSILSSAIIAPIIPVGIYFGRKLHDVLSQDYLYMACYALTLVAGIKMGVEALT